jgi:hypothetical protein
MGLSWWFRHSRLSKQQKTIDGKSEDYKKIKAQITDFCQATGREQQTRDQWGWKWQSTPDVISVTTICIIGCDYISHLIIYAA